MKTDIYRFEKEAADTLKVTEAASKIAKYNDLDKKQELKLSLLSEELVDMLPNLLKYGKGMFWIENEGKKFEIHAVVEPDGLLPSSERDRILSVSATGDNAAAVGIMNKIRIAAEVMMANYAVTAGSNVNMYPDSPYAFYDMGVYPDVGDYANAWSLSIYKQGAKNKTEAWDELEKSIIANMADDVIVGIIGGKVEITIKKSFE